MKLLTDEIRIKLEENGRKQHAVKGTQDEIDFVLVARLYTPLMNTVWLLTEIDPEDADMVFGLEDSGDGSHELQYVSLMELENRFAQQSVRRDKDFRTEEPLSRFVERARE